MSSMTASCISLSSLFPVSIEAGFTTSQILDLPRNVKHVTLSDESLGVHKVTPRTSHRVITLNGSDTPAWEAFYPLGSINPSATIPGGFNFYLDFGAQLGACATHVLGSYRVLFEQDFDWVKGGKLPGLCEFLSFGILPAMHLELKLRRWRRRRFIL